MSSRLDQAPAGVSPILALRGLSVVYRSLAGSEVAAVRGVDLELARGESLGILGESGCGKSTLCFAIQGLLPPAARVAAGQASFEGRDLLRLGESELRRIRGDRMSMVFQEPGLALNPCLKVGTQIVDVLRAHRPVDHRRARQEALEVLERVRFAEPHRIYGSYPHQLSGGQQQRAMLAQALICRPSLLIADEPTAALDATTQLEIVSLLRDLQREMGMAMLFVSHDPALLTDLSDRLLVMYAGRVAESGPRDRVLGEPLHPYTRGLLECVPAAQPPGPGQPRVLHAIPGAPPDLADLPAGCPFEPRCPDRFEECRERTPPLLALPGGRRVACLLYPNGEG